MFELDREVRNWRTRVERGSSLSARELDELEDHLRARVDLELELNPVLSTDEAMAIATEGLGQPTAISREFAKAGRPRWRRLLLAGWAMYAVSFLLPAFTNPNTDASIYGYGVFVDVIRSIQPSPSAAALLMVMLGLPNLIMLTTLPAFWRRHRARRAWISWVVAATGALPAGLGLLRITNGGLGWNLGAGYWMWSASFVVVATALWVRSRDWASVRPTKSTA
jgi:hypothetical protein